MTIFWCYCSTVADLLLAAIAGSTTASLPVPPPQAVHRELVKVRSQAMDPDAKPIDPVLLKEALALAEPLCASSPPSEVNHYLRTLFTRAESLRPAFRAILADPNSEPQKVSGTFAILINVKIHELAFTELAIRRLTDTNSGVRSESLRYLERFGGLEESSKILPLLCDNDMIVRYLAARVIAKLGVQSDLTTIDAWLKNGKLPQDGEYLIHVKKCRDELEKRLKENPVPKDFRDSPAP